MPQLMIDNRAIDVPEDATILEAARSAGVRIPTLCHLHGLPALGACRVCLVEVERSRTLVAACATPVSDGMRVRTNTRRVREARRAVVEFLLSAHAGDCQTCDRNADCGLQALAWKLGVRAISFPGEKCAQIVDESTPALRRDSGKCILCRRCVTVCNEVQEVGALFPQGRGFRSMIAPAFRRDLSTVVCVQCGQCAAVCPVGAISERDQVAAAWEALDDPRRHVIVQTAPAIRAALGECFGYPSGTLVTGKMVAALRRLGFAAVFDTNFTADLTIMEESTELLGRLRSALADGGGTALPMFTSCCPAWIKFGEHLYPRYLPHYSTCKSPQQMFGALAKTHYAEAIGKSPADITVVSIMPCTAKKYEAERPEMVTNGVRDVDIVLTTRELARMIKQAGIDFVALADDHMDAPMGFSSGAADIFANTGGVMEAALRTAYEEITGRTMPGLDLHLPAIAGLQGIKEAALQISGTRPEWSFLEGVSLRVAVVHGLGNARRLIDGIDRGQSDYHFVEVMACPGGCIGGGGQPRMTSDALRQARISAIYREDESKSVRTSHENREISQLYAGFLIRPLGERSHRLLHTRYSERSCV